MAPQVVETNLAKPLHCVYGFYMTTTVEAIYEGGKLILPKALPLPEKAHVRVTIQTEDEQSDTERAAWLKLSEQSLMQTWDNLDDDIFNELLKK